MADDQILEAEPAAAASPAGAAPIDGGERPAFVRLEFPITVLVVGALAPDDLKRLRDAVIGELQNTLDEGI